MTVEIVTVEIVMVEIVTVEIVMVEIMTVEIVTVEIVKVKSSQMVLTVCALYTDIRMYTHTSFSRCLVTLTTLPLLLRHFGGRCVGCFELDTVHKQRHTVNTGQYRCARYVYNVK